MADAAELLTLYDAQVRGRVTGAVPDGMRVERDVPLVRLVGWSIGGFVECADADGLGEAELDELIAREVAFFGARGEEFEWKTYGHDRAPFAARLLAAGFVPEEVETIVIAAVDDVAAEPRPPDGVTLRKVTDRSDLDRIDGLEQAVWSTEHQHAGDLEAELAADPESLAIVVAEAGGTVVCAGWVRFARGTNFASLWGGATLPEWRGRGIYRATVAYRAGLAARGGFRHLQVDAPHNSRPILERLGFVPVTTTTPYRWSPPPAAGGP